MTKAAKFWDKVARKYSRNNIKDIVSYEYTLERTRSYLKPTDRVLELGAGTSSTALLLAENAGSYVASDISPEMIAIGNEKLSETKLKNLTIEVGTVTDFARKQAEFDVIMGFNLFHLAKRPEDVFEQIGSMLPVGGLFISKTPCLADESNVLKRLMFRLAIPVLTTLGFAPRPVHMFKVASFDAMIESAGFEIIESGIHPASPPSRYIVARKT